MTTDSSKSSSSEKISPLNVAIVGASLRSTMIYTFFEKYPDYGKVVGIYDKVSSKAKYLIDHYKLSDALIYESLEQAVSDPKAGAVFVGTSDNEHVEPAVAALKDGKHVFCEKPMAITLEDCDAIITAAEDSKNIFYLGMNLRHSPVYEKMHQILSAGELGKVLTIETNEYYEDGRSYFRRWNRLRKLSGGLWITKTCHDFDLINWFSGGKPKRIFATSNLSFYKPKPEGSTHCRACPIKDKCPDYYDVETPKEEVRDRLQALTEEATGAPRDLCLYNSDKDTFDNAIAVIDYDNDVRATHTVNVVSARQTRQMRLMGTKASAEADMEEGWVKVWGRYGGSKDVYDLRELIDSGHGGADDCMLLDFFRCCQTADKPRSSWMEGRLNIKVGLAARQSADTGQPVLIDE